MADILAATETDMKQMLSAKCHLGTKTVDPNMRRYMWTKKDSERCEIKQEVLYERLLRELGRHVHV
jgi:ribosomal protein S2